MIRETDFQTYIYLNHNQFIIYVVEILTKHGLVPQESFDVIKDKADSPLSADSTLNPSF